MELKELDLRYVLSGLVILGVTLFFLFKRKKYNLPPGPWGVPVLGYLPFLSKEPHKDFHQLSQKYGKVFSLYMGKSLVVILNDIKSVKEAFNNSAILDRPEGLFDSIPNSLGFAAHNGNEWVEQRRYAMRAMKDIGLGKSGWDSLLEEEVNDFIKIIEDKAGRPVDILDPLSASVSNNVTSLVFGKRFPAGDPNRKIIDKWVETVIKLTLQTNATNIFPFLGTIMKKLGIGDLNKSMKDIYAFVNMLRRLIDKRKEMLEEGDEEIFIDGYLKEIQRRKTENSTFNEKNMMGNIQALVAGGSETTRTSILWLLLAMIDNPEIQAKVQSEIDAVLGKEGKTTWMQRATLPYTYATIMEAQRWISVVPIGVTHSASEDTKIGNYDIPKDTNVISNIWAVHMDPDYWKDPEKFRPERFLTKDGKLLMQKPESYAAFSLGRRSCPGEFVALVEIFQYFTAIMQKFSVMTPLGVKPNFRGVLGGTYYPPPQKLIFNIRN